MAINFMTPVGSNFVKDWPSQNNVNVDLIDNYAGPCLITQPVSTYTPVLTASVTNPVMGTGATAIGRYYKIFDQIYVWGEVRFGSTGATFGSGTYQISLPFRAKTNISSGSPYSTPICVGNAVAFKVAGTPIPAVSLLGNPDYLIFQVKMSTATREVNPTSPFVWAGGSPGDGLMFHAKYQREP